MSVDNTTTSIQRRRVLRLAGTGSHCAGAQGECSDGRGRPRGRVGHVGFPCIQAPLASRVGAYHIRLQVTDRCE